MLVRLGEIDLLLMVWAALVLGSLQSRLLLSATAHSICGPWGCGPETAAIVTMHAGWLAIIGPPPGLLPLKVEVVECPNIQIVAWPGRCGLRRCHGNCCLAMVGLAAAGEPMVKRLHLAAVRIRSPNRG
jgi:hypothetical protein